MYLITFNTCINIFGEFSLQLSSHIINASTCPSPLSCDVSTGITPCPALTPTQGSPASATFLCLKKSVRGSQPFAWWRAVAMASLGHHHHHLLDAPRHIPTLGTHLSLLGGMRKRNLPMKTHRYFMLLFHGKSVGGWVSG